MLFAQPGGGTGAFDVKHHAFVLPAGAAGNLTATPASQPVTTAVPATVTVGWSGLVAGTRYLGQIQYTDGDGTRSATRSCRSAPSRIVGRHAADTTTNRPVGAEIAPTG